MQRTELERDLFASLIRVTGVVAVAGLIFVGASMPLGLRAASDGSFGARSAVGGVNCTALRLDLRPGFRGPSRKVQGSIPKNMPKYSIPVQLPLKAGAKPSKVPSDMLAESPGDANYTKSAVAGFTFHGLTGPIYSWTQWALRTCGWHSTGYGAGGGATVISFDSFQFPGPGSAQLNVSYGNAPHGGTYMLYDVYAFSYPVRPKASYIPYDLKSMNITFKPRLGAPTFHAVIRDSVEMNALADAFNIGWPNEDGYGEHGCLAFGPSATVVARTKTGRTLTAHVNGACDEWGITVQRAGKRHDYAFSGLNTIVDTLKLIERIH